MRILEFSDYLQRAASGVEGRLAGRGRKIKKFATIRKQRKLKKPEN